MDKLIIYGINGPVVTIKGKTSLSMLEMVFVGKNRLIGEVISITNKYTTIQVYENTTGLKPGEPVASTGSPMMCTLGPGLIAGIYDGIGRPLKKLEEISGYYIAPGIDVPTVDTEKLWNVDICVCLGDWIKPGSVYGICKETDAVIHKIIVPPGIEGKVTFAVASGNYKVNDVIVSLANTDGEVNDLTLIQKWPIRRSRPVANRLMATEPLVTGQRIIDTLFPISKGGAAAIPGGFGTGKTMLQHQLAKWSDADIIVYIGCGERGNEMTQVLEEFSELKDPRTGMSMLERTVLIANTSNMPVAAREASIYTGVTIAEYYRDMGYNVAVMADSTSRWAEALREISGRLEEMPAEEGFPAYLPSRLSAFYERAGYIETLSGDKASITIIGAVSPQGNDFSEPVTQNTKRFIRCFWALEKSLAYARHYPAINWSTSYSEYNSELADWYKVNVAEDFAELRNKIQNLLHEESKLMEIVKLIGSDLLADDQKLILEISRVIRIGFLQQNAMHENDCYVTIKKQYLMMKYIIALYEKAHTLVQNQIPVSKLKEYGIFEQLIKSKYEIPNDNLEMFETVWKNISDSISAIEKIYEN